MSWPTAKLSEVAPHTPLKKIIASSEDVVLQLTLDHIESDSGVLLTKNYQPVSDAGSSTHWFDERYVLYSKLRPYLNKVYMPEEKGLGTTELVPMLPDAGRLDRKYLAYYLRSRSFVDWVSAQTAGAKMPRVSMKVFWNHEIPLPPLKTQKQIAAILEKADQLRKDCQQMEQEFNNLAQSVFMDMFGDPVSNPKGWKKQKLSELMTIKRGGSPRPIEKFVGGTIPWIKIGDATKGDDIYLSKTKEKIKEEGLSKTVFLDPGSVIFANCGVSLGFARILNIGGCIHDGWLSFSDIDENTVRKIFLLKALNSITEHFRKIAPDGTQPNLNTGIMKSFELIVPPISLQDKFGKVIDWINEEKAASRKMVEASEENFNSIMQKAFNGELNIKNKAA